MASKREIVIFSHKTQSGLHTFINKYIRIIINDYYSLVYVNFAFEDECHDIKFRWTIEKWFSLGVKYRTVLCSSVYLIYFRKKRKQPII